MTAQVETRIEAGIGRVLVALEEREKAKEGVIERLKRVAAGATTTTTASTSSTPLVEDPAIPSTTTPPSPPTSPTPTQLEPKPYHPLFHTPAFTLSSLPTLLPSLPTLTSQTPHDLLEGAKDVADRSKEFVEKGWEGEGRERDLMVVAGGSAVVGGGLIWALFR